MPPLIRAFLAVPAGEQLGRELTRRLDAVRPAVPVRWTRPETWHLTLQFLGDWPPERLERLAEALPAAAERPAWAAPVGGLGAFPDLRRPRVLFLQVRDDDGSLAALASGARRLVAAAWPGGPQDPKAFRAHLTVARVRDALETRHIKILQDMDLSGLPALPVERIDLLASELRREGSRHRVLASAGLRKKGE